LNHFWGIRTFASARQMEMKFSIFASGDTESRGGGSLEMTD